MLEADLVGLEGKEDGKQTKMDEPQSLGNPWLCRPNVIWITGTGNSSHPPPPEPPPFLTHSLQGGGHPLRTRKWYRFHTHWTERGNWINVSSWGTKHSVNLWTSPNKEGVSSRQGPIKPRPRQDATVRGAQMCRENTRVRAWTCHVRAVWLGLSCWRERNSNALLNVEEPAQGFSVLRSHYRPLQCYFRHCFPNCPSHDISMPWICHQSVDVVHPCLCFRHKESKVFCQRNSFLLLGTILLCWECMS